MKIVANLLLVLSLSAGALAAATAYLVPLDLPDAELERLTLNAPAGKVPQPDGRSRPLVDRKDAAGKVVQLTPELLAQLRANGVEYVTVKEFAFSRWPGRWVFLAAAAGLLVAAGLLRASARREVAGAASQRAEAPERALRETREALAGLRRDLPKLPDEPARLRAILERLGELQRTHLPTFVEGRPFLIARLGMGGFAELMDRFAAAERQVNRAWSAAADGVYEEAVDCIDQAMPFLDEAIERLTPAPASG
jgi:hypothetical protein